MAWEIDTATDGGAGGLAHYDFLDRLKTFATTNADLVSDSQQWTTLRDDRSTDNWELILHGTGLSGDDDIYIGFRTYQSVGADYYNIVAAVFTGYVSGNSFDTQPGAILSGIPAHNLTIDYYLIGNGQRLAFGLKVGTPVYMSGYAGKMLPFARPDEFRAPLVCAGMLDGVPATRFSDPSISMPYKGARNNFRLRSNGGIWIAPETSPWNCPYLCAPSNGNETYHIRPSGDQYFPLRVELNDNTPNQYGVLDGIYYISGFNNSVENVLQMGGGSVFDQTGHTLNEIITGILGVGGRAFLVIEDCARTGFNDYYAMEMG